MRRSPRATAGWSATTTPRGAHGRCPTRCARSSSPSFGTRLDRFSGRMPESKYDMIVIGSGPGGYVAAIRAAQLGMKTAVVEKDAVGGRCLNVACIPAKAVLRAADVLQEVRDADDFGVVTGEPTVDYPAVMARREKVIKTLTGGV